MTTLFNPVDHEVQDDPYPHYRRLRDEAPCYHNAALGFYAVSRFQDCWDVYHNWQTFSSAAGPSMELSREGSEFSLLGLDPPDHTRLRKLVSRAFTPTRVALLESRIRDIFVELGDALTEGKQIDFHTAIAAQVPMRMICELLGVPVAMGEQIVAWADKSLDREFGELEPPAEAVAADKALRGYLYELLQERKAAPGEDLISGLIAATDEDGKERLTDNDIVAFMNLMAAAGNETTAKLLSNAIVLLATHPEQRRLLLERPELMGGALDEILRFEPPSQNTGRVTMTDMNLHGVAIPAGSRILILTGSACRDEREYPNPDSFAIQRMIKRQLFFGHGPHICLGKALARLEGQVVLTEWLRRFPDYSVDTRGLARTHQAHVRGYAKVPVQL